MTIAITGSTGKLGRLVIQKLKARVDPSTIIALVRDPAKGQELGVALREGDYDRPDQLNRSLAGVTTLLLISSPTEGDKASQHRNVIDAAVNCGVKRIVYTSTLHADSSQVGSAADHYATEQALDGSGLTTTILRNGWYMENHVNAFRAAADSGALYGCAGDGRFSSASRSDYADAAVNVLTATGHEGKIYELAGDESYTLAEAADAIARQTGKSVIYRNLPEADYIATLTKTGMPPALATRIAKFDIAASKGSLFNSSGALSGLIGHTTETLERTISRIVNSSGR